MAHFFRAPDRRQRFLFPVDMMDWLPEDDIVYLIVDAVDVMDLSGFEATCKVGHAGQGVSVRSGASRTSPRRARTRTSSAAPRH